MMEERQKLWRARLMGDAETCVQKRHLYHTFIEGQSIVEKGTRITIRADVPRTFVGVDMDREALETLLVSYAAVQRGDGYLQGFNYLMGTILHVFYGTEECMADTWWCFARVVGLIRPMMPDFNVAWFHWCRRQWCSEFHIHMKKRRPLLNSILRQRQEELSSLMTVRWFMVWFAQTVAFEELPVLWDFIIQQRPQQLMRVYTLLACAIVEEAATTISYEGGDDVAETIHAVLSLKIRGVAELLNQVKKRL